MPNSANKTNLTVWLPSVIPLVLVCVSGVTAYTDVTRDLAIVRLEAIALKEEDIRADKYDRFLQRQVEKNERRLLVVETKQTDVIATQIRLERKLDKVLTEMQGVNTSITRLATIQENKQTGNAP